MVETKDVPNGTKIVQGNKKYTKKGTSSRFSFIWQREPKLLIGNKKKDELVVYCYFLWHIMVLDCIGCGIVLSSVELYGLH